MQPTPAQAATPSTPRLVRFGIFEADLSAGELRKGGSKIRLQEQPLQILAMLLERPGQIVTREELRSRLWPGDTFVDFEHGVNSGIARLRDALGDSADSPRYIETLPRRGYRLIASVENPTEVVKASAAPANGAAAVIAEATPAVREKLPEPAPAAGQAKFSFRRLLALGTVGAGLLGIVAYFLFLRPTHALTETDSIVLAEFANSTGDPVFDNTLRQALIVKLIDSPFLNVVPDERMRDTLRFMGRSPDERLTAATAREVCQRLSSKAMLSGSISRLGDHYSVLLEATNCATGESLARAGTEAVGMGGVLKALDTATAEIRRKLGESLSSIQKNDVPIEQATTTSLEALKAFSLGQVARNHGMERESIPYFQNAIELDPNFAMAYAVLGQAYANSGEESLSREYTQKAFDGRERASEREDLYISSHYYENVSGDLDRTIQIYELWRSTYPRDVIPAINLGSLYNNLGQPEKALPELAEAQRLDPNSAFVYSNLVFSYLALNRTDEAKATLQQARARGLDAEDLHILRYTIAWLENDTTTMKQEAAWANENQPNHGLLGYEGSAAASRGHLRTAEALFRQAAGALQSNGHNEAAAQWEAFAALIEAEFGRSDEARQLARTSLNTAKGTEGEVAAALAFARSGEISEAAAIATDLGQRFPSDTLLNRLDLPTIRAAQELARGNAAAALQNLETTRPYDLAKTETNIFGYAPYLRGQAYLRAGDGKSAEAEFQKLLDHRSLVSAFPQSALALLGLGRARALSGNVSGGRVAYQDFLALWKDADPAIPVLQQARAEYSRLH